jgi:cytidylate kinase
MGTVVFPDADVKFFLDASPENRAMRRFRELESLEAISLEQVKADMSKRDFDDSHRKIAPLKQAEDAVRIDSSNLSIDEVLEAMLSRIEALRT